MDLTDADRRLREIVATIPADVRPFLLQILTSDEELRAQEIGALYAAGTAPSLVELLIDAEVDPVLRGVLVRVLREKQRGV